MVLVEPGRTHGATNAASRRFIGRSDQPQQAAFAATVGSCDGNAQGAAPGAVQPWLARWRVGHLHVLEREYQLFTESVNQWKALQAERYDRKKSELGDALEARRQQLLDRWEHAALRTRLQELEYSLKMQRKRLGLLLQQVQLTPQPA